VIQILYEIERCLHENSCAVQSTIVHTREFDFSVEDEMCAIQRDKVREWNVIDPKLTLFGSCRDGN